MTPNPSQTPGPTAAEPTADSRPGGDSWLRWVIAVGVGVAVVSRCLLAWTNQGVIQPDEIFQSLEQGHRWIFGFGVRPWEFRAGARSWLLPGTLGMAMKVASALGVTSGVGI